MTRINTNVAALIGAHNLNTNNTSLNTTLQRLSTGYRINSGKDDPAGLIASETLRSDLAAINSALKNNERANSIISTAEGALSEVSDLLISMQELVGEAANSGGLTNEEIDANQLQVDGIIDSINRIANQTSFEGKRLLDGSMGFQTATASGTVEIQDIKVNAAKAEDSDMTLTVNVDSIASQAVNATAVATSLGNSMTVQITGNKGSETFFFARSATSAEVKAAVNAASSITGVYMSSDGKLRSVDYGSDAFVRVELIAGTEAGLAVESDEGADAIISINGQKASVDNYDVSLRNNTVDINFKVTDDLISSLSSETITISAGGGAKFQINQKIDETGQVIMGLPSITAPHLGSVQNGFLSDLRGGSASDLSTDPESAAAIVGDAIAQVATLRGRMGSFLKDTVSSTINSLNVASENVSAADSVIRETDFATETAALTRNQILVNASTSVLAVANSAPQSVLALIG